MGRRFLEARGIPGSISPLQRRDCSPIFFFLPPFILFLPRTPFEFFSVGVKILLSWSLARAGLVRMQLLAGTYRHPSTQNGCMLGLCFLTHLCASGIRTSGTSAQSPIFFTNTRRQLVFSSSSTAVWSKLHQSPIESNVLAAQSSWSRRYSLFVRFDPYDEATTLWSSAGGPIPTSSITRQGTDEQASVQPAIDLQLSHGNYAITIP